jgi:predicted lipoprotein with Yx(FWY)xxD motif/cytochrome c5
MVRSIVTAAAALLALGLLLAAAQDMGQAQQTVIQVAEHDAYGPYLTDGEGRSLYLFLNDQNPEPYREPYPSTCYQRCAENWPALVVEEWPPEGAEAVAGEGVDETLVATVEREDGTLQLTYANWPLYYFARDENPGDTNGLGVGDVWYLTSPQGGATEEAQAAVQDEVVEADGITSELFAALVSEGEREFANNCATCHGAEGQGGQGPGLTNRSRVVANKDRLIRQIMRGSEMMPSFRHLSDRQIAAVATFVRSSWENDHGPVAEEEVSEWR